MSRSIFQITIPISLLFIVTVLGFAADADGKQPTQEEMKKKMEMWKEVATPGPEHAILAKIAGKWDKKISMQWSPESKVSVSNGTQTAEMILGGRYLWTTETANIGGMQSEGRMLLAFDKAKKEYLMTSIDNMSTIVLTAHGTGSEDGKTITLHGDEAKTDGKEKAAEYIFKFIDNDHYTKVMWKHPKQGEPFKALEIDYLRSK